VNTRLRDASAGGGEEHERRRSRPPRAREPGRRGVTAWLPAVLARRSRCSARPRAWASTLHAYSPP